jgi:GT2 family glycosyltransferase
VGGGQQGAGDVVRLPGVAGDRRRLRDLAFVVRVPRLSQDRPLFWWAEDTEYLQWRIPEAGYPRQVVDGALVEHDAIRQGDGVPLWKYYYEARNMLYVSMHLKRRLGHYPRNLSKLAARAIWREKHGRLRRLGVIARGLFDGAFGRLGIRYPVEPMRERATPPGDGRPEG